ncbi:MAG: Clp protease [Actinomycetales bacterium]|nr:Clp protease [Actinomycetales bacterium]
MFEHFTRTARDAVVGSQETAARLGHPAIGTVHLLLAVTDRPGRVADALAGNGVTAVSVERELTALLDAVTTAPGTPTEWRGDVAIDDAAALAAIGIDLDRIREAVESRFGEGVLDRPVSGGASGRRGLGRLLGRRGGRRRGRGRPVRELDLLRSTSGEGRRHLPFTPAARKALELALREAIRLGSREITEAHLLLGLLRTGEGTAAAVLGRLAVPTAQLRTVVESGLRRSA